MSQENQCEQCGRSYSRLSSLTRHTKSRHGKRWHHECKKCRKLFARSDTLRRHRLKFHGAQQPASPAYPPIFPRYYDGQYGQNLPKESNSYPGHVHVTSGMFVTPCPVTATPTERNALPGWNGQFRLDPVEATNDLRTPDSADFQGYRMNQSTPMVRCPSQDANQGFVQDILYNHDRTPQEIPWPKRTWSGFFLPDTRRTTQPILGAIQESDDREYWPQVCIYMTGPFPARTRDRNSARMMMRFSDYKSGMPLIAM